MNRKVLLGSLAGLAVLVVLAALAVPFLVPTATLRAEIERRVSQQTGRALRIGGALNFTLFPSLGLAAHTVTLANAPWGHAAALLRVDEMQIAVKVLPLLHGRFEVDRIVLDKPAIALEVARDGSANWKLISTERGSARIGPPPNTVLAGIVVQDGALSYDNDKLGVHRAIDALDANVSVTRLDAPAGAQGTFMFRGRRLAYTLTLKTVQSLFAGRRTQADVALVSDLVTAGFSGQVTRDGTVDGAISLHTGSLKEVAAWLGHAISAGHGLGALDVKATIKAKDRSLSIGLDAARLDGMTAHGTLAADLAGAVPDVTGTLAFDRLDLNTYLGAPAGPPGPAAPRAPGPAPMQSGWSRAPVNLNLLKLLDGRVTLSTDSLSVLHLKTGKTTILATLAGGAMTAHLGPMQLYGGTGQADLAVDARGSVPLVANRLTFTGIAMAPFLADTIGVDKIDG
ncbi:MAG TPA: AsmA family protein, partial [Rhizomicrobium sp.]